jgi:hypothetical protein
VTDPLLWPSAGKEGFFTIDRRTWSAICDLNDMNAAIAYLVLGNGTGRSNNATRWSAQSLKNWTDMPWRNGKEAISTLFREGFIVDGPRHTEARPVYELPSWEVIRSGSVEDLLPWEDDGFDASLEIEPTPKTELIWLPNSLVTGTSSGEMPPLKKLRLAGNIWSLRLLVDLYHVHHLESDSGVRSDFLRDNYSRLKVGQQGSSTVWGFTLVDRQGRWEGPLKSHEHRPLDEDGEHPVWRSVEALEKMGLISFIPHFYPNSRFEEPLHSLGEAVKGAEPEEEELRNAARAAAEALVQPGQIDWAYCEGGYDLLVPAHSWMEDVQVRGVVRLKYRPHTNATARWYQALREAAFVGVSRYNELRARALAARPAQTEWRAWNM